MTELKKERRSGTYAAVKYTSATCNVLKSLMDMYKIPNQVGVNDIHSTLIYSRVKIPTSEYRNFNENTLSKMKWVFRPTSFDLFNSSASSTIKNVLVMKIDAPELKTLHKEIISIGATHDFEEYEPHITLSYDVNESFDLDKLNIPTFINLLPSEIYFESLDLNWKS